MLLHYRELGEGTPFVILHGLFGNSDNWQTHAKRISEYYRVILVDQRNHGHSAWHEEFTYDIMADDLDRLMQHLGIDKFILMGHSMGGKTAMWYAHKFPNKLEKMIVVDIGIKQYPMHHNEIIKGIRSVPLENVASRSEAEKSLLPFVDSYGVRQFLLKNLYWKEKGQLALRVNLKVLTENIAEVGEALPSEIKFLKDTLFLRGEKSNYILPQDESLITHHFPKAKLITISNAGHWLHAENPEEFFDVLKHFVE